MWFSTKSVSSPGRAEKFPPPLMRFLRTNTASKSRARPKSSPMFVLRKKTTAAAIETQDPSSPKVTCIGQVRVRRSKQSRVGKRTQMRVKCRCKWIRNALSRCSLSRCSLSCCSLSWCKKLKPKSLKPLWSKWVSFFCVGFRRKRRSSRSFEESPKIGSELSRNKIREEEDVVVVVAESEDENGRGDLRVYPSFSISSLSPPKNALSLTRSRSAPYRSSSLACRFWGSPIATEEKTEQNEEEEEEAKTQSSSNSDKKWRRGGDVRGGVYEKIGSCRDLVNSELIRVRFSSDGRIEESRATEEIANSRPLILTRCKSEPARILHTHEISVSLSVSAE